MSNSVDLDQTLNSEASDLGLNYLLRQCSDKYVPHFSKTYVVCMVNVLNFQTLYSILLMPKFCLFIYAIMFLKLISGMANSEDPIRLLLQLSNLQSALFTYVILSESLAYKILPYSTDYYSP